MIPVTILLFLGLMALPVKGGSALIGCLDSAYASLGILLLQERS